jgi:hypothetical protein
MTFTRYRVPAALVLTTAVLALAGLGAQASGAANPYAATGFLRAELRNIQTGAFGNKFCTAWVASSANQSVIGTAAHCTHEDGWNLVGFSFFPDGKPADPYGASAPFTAGPSDLYVDPRNSYDGAYDFAFIVVHPGNDGGVLPVAARVSGGGFPIRFGAPYPASATAYGFPGSAAPETVQSCGPSATGIAIPWQWQWWDPLAMSMSCNFDDVASGGPWVDSSGSVVASSAQANGATITGTYLGDAAWQRFNAAQWQSPYRGNYAISSCATNLFVSTEVGYTGGNYAMLRARAQVIGPWERYSFSTDSNGYLVIRSLQNNMFVSAELGYTGANQGMLRARASTPGPWEEFWPHYDGNGCWSFESHANGLFASAELGYTGPNYGMLRARAGVVGPWEEFHIYPI